MAAGADGWAIVAHLDARGGLSAATRHYERQLVGCRSRLAGLALQVVEEGRGSEPSRVRRWVVGRERGRAQSEAGPSLAPGDSGAAALEAFTRWGRARVGGSHVALLVMGHGGEECGLPPGALRAALAGAASRGPWDLLALDVCYGATVESLYELRAQVRYVTAAPGVIATPGLDWAEVLEGAGAQASPVGLAKALVTEGTAGQAEPLVALDLSQMDVVASGVKKLAASLRATTPEVADRIAVVRGRGTSWGEGQASCDLLELARGLEGNLEAGPAREAASEVAKGVAGLVLARSPGLGDGCGGLGLFFPAALGEVPPEYETGTAWGREVGWGAFLRSYWSYARGKFAPGQP